MSLTLVVRRVLLISPFVFAASLGGAGSALLGVCGPFTDVAADAFCPFVLEIFTLGITTGTTPTTYSPTDPVNRLQMAAFLSRSVDGVLKRGGPRAAMGQFWTTEDVINLGVTTIGGNPFKLQFDGTDVWVADLNSDRVLRVRGTDAKLLETWTGASSGSAVLSARNRIFVTAATNPGRLYRIDPTQPAGAVTTVASNLGNNARGIAYDGSRIWTANANASGPISIVTPGASIPWTVLTLSSGLSALGGILYDGANIWVTVTATVPGTLLKLNSSGTVLQTVTIGAIPFHPTFDGANIWVPNFGDSSVSVVRASSGAVLATLTGNGLDGPFGAAFDGQRVLITSASGNSVSLWKAADLTTIGSVATGAGTSPFGVCSDGISFWITLLDSGQLLRY